MYIYTRRYTNTLIQLSPVGYTNWSIQQVRALGSSREVLEILYCGEHLNTFNNSQSSALSQLKWENYGRKSRAERPQAGMASQIVCMCNGVLPVVF